MKLDAIYEPSKDGPLSGGIVLVLIAGMVLQLVGREIVHFKVFHRIAQVVLMPPGNVNRGDGTFRSLLIKNLDIRPKPPSLAHWRRPCAGV